MVFPGKNIDRLAELLVQSGLISQRKLVSRIALAKRLGMTNRQILIYSGDISRELIMSAFRLYYLVMDRHISFRQAVEALSRVASEGITYQEALKDFGFSGSYAASPHSMGQLLKAANVLTDEDLVTALELSAEEAVPLGHILIQRGYASPDVVAMTLKVQDELRSAKRASYSDVVRRIRLAAMESRVIIPSLDG